MCLAKRDKAALDALLWRAKTITSRQKKEVWKATRIILIFMVFALVLQFLSKPQQLDIKAQDFYTVTSSADDLTNAGGQNYFGSNSGGPEMGITTNFSLPNCTSFQAPILAYIVPDVNGGYYNQTMKVIENTLEIIKNAYILNNPQSNLDLIVKSFQTQQDLINYVDKSTYGDSNNQICLAVGFSDFNLATASFTALIQIYPGWIPNNRLDQVKFQSAQFAVSLEGKGIAVPLTSQYNTTGFYQIMSTLTQQVILQTIDFQGNLSGNPNPNWTLAFMPMNTGQFTYNPVQTTMAFFVGLLVSSITMAQGQLIGQVIFEPHELQLKQMFRQSGMSVEVEVLFRLIIYMIIAAIAVPLIAIFLSLLILKNVSFGVIFIFVVLYCCETYLLTTLLSYGFGKYAVVANLVYFVISILIMILTLSHPTLTPQIVAWTSILPPMQAQNFARLSFVALNENPLNKINISTLSTPITGIKPSIILIIGLIDLIFLVLMLFYLWPLYFRVDPEKNLRFYYPFTCSYWRGSEQVATEVDDDPELGGLINVSNASLLGSEHSNNGLLQDEEKTLVQEGNMEALRGNEQPDVLRISKLVKKFGTKTAVNNLTLTLFKDQILVLLGHNGAGKTTTISMLTGEIKATSGQATAYGINLLDDNQATDLITFCPQHNVLIDKLTVQENLIFFCKFRAVERPEALVAQTLTDFNMTHKQHAYPPNLSGGQKRKLQLMIALVGNSKIILLDEPSSGMDPNSRRDTWNILKKLKKDKIIVLTTHYMDEAEVLGDRIAIVSHGKLQSCGSSLFLKNKFSNGFFIQITKFDQSNDSTLGRFEEILKSYLAKTEDYSLGNSNFIKNVDETGRTVYTVPKSLGGYFDTMFQNVDANLESLNIAEYSIRSASLEEVFIEIGEREKRDPNDDSRFSRSSSRASLKEERTELGEKSKCRSINAFIRLNLRTSIPKFFCAIIMTPILIAVACSIAVINSKLYPKQIILSQPQSIYPTPIELPYNILTGNNSQIGTGSLFNSGQESQYQVLYQPVIYQQSDVSNVTSLGYWAEQIQNTGNFYFGSFFVYNLSPIDQPTQTSIAVYGNLQSLSAQTVFGNLMMNVLGQYYTGNNAFQISFINQPLPYNTVLMSETSVGTASTFAVFTLMIYGILSLIIAAVVLNRFTSGFYNVLMMKSGERSAYFWSMYFVDVSIHLISLIFYYAVLYGFGFRLAGFWFVCLLFAFANPLFLYTVVILSTFVFRKPSSYPLGIFAASLGAFYFLMSIIGSFFYSQNLQKTVAAITSIFCFLPVANFVDSFTYILTFKQRAIWHDKIPQNESALGKYGAQRYVIAQIFLIIIYGITMLLVLANFGYKKPKYDGMQPINVDNEDKNVLNERKRVQETFESKDSDYVKALNLVKRYDQPDPNPPEDIMDRPSFLPIDEEDAQNQAKGSIAVKGVSFGVKQGECFALLGVSGAGKSSTFNMIVGEENLSGGMCTLDGVSVEDIYKRPELLVGKVGYCPQTNCIEDSLTVKQTLTYICDLLGVRAQTVPAVVRDTIARFGLTEFTNTLAGALSGGNKRKLCCAMSMLGNPKVIFVDEASAGVDPVSRRTMWKGMRYEAINSSLILTTHTMEEAEALASKIGIMASGRFKCFGSLQQIQNDYGSGFEIEINLDIVDLDQQIGEIDEDKRHTTDVQFIKEQLAQWQQALNEREIQVMFDFADEFDKQKLFDTHYMKVVSNEPTDLVQFQKDVQIQNAVSFIVADLTEHISLTTIKQFDGSYLQLRLDKNERITYGKIYGYLEKMQQRHPIREYSCKQASLEQIFVSFAQQDGLKVFNRRMSQFTEARRSLQT